MIVWVITRIWVVLHLGAVGLSRLLVVGCLAIRLLDHSNWLSIVWILLLLLPLLLRIITGVWVDRMKRILFLSLSLSRFASLGLLVFAIFVRLGWFLLFCHKTGIFLRRVDFFALLFLLSRLVRHLSCLLLRWSIVMRVTKVQRIWQIYAVRYFSCPLRVTSRLWLFLQGFVSLIWIAKSFFFVIRVVVEI